MSSVRRSARISNSAAVLAPEVLKPAENIAKPAATSRKRKPAALEAGAAPQETDLPVRPSTPPQKRPRGRPVAAAKALPAEAEDEAEAEPPVPKRHHGRTKWPIANPNATNAPLLSPETSRIVSSLPLDSLNTPSAKSKTTTANILEEACAHLVRVEPKMKPLVEAHHCHVFSPESLAEQVDPFESIASGIISQQVSGAAARAIKGRFVGLFELGGSGEKTGDKKQAFPHPSQVAAMSIEKLRSAGLSQRKAEYIRGLAEKFVSGELSAQLLADAPYDTLVERLVAVRGLGLWSVEMFAMFGLKRMDVFSVGDLGVQRGMAAFAGRDIAKLKRAGSSSSMTKKNAKWKYMTDTEMVAMAEPFRPYRSVFMWYMWQVESVDISTMG